MTSRRYGSQPVDALEALVDTKASRFTTEAGAAIAALDDL